MSDFLDFGLNQEVTYWAPGTPDAFGKPSFAAPVTSPGRWEERTEIFTIFSSGEETRSKVVAFMDKTVALGGYLALGIQTAADPTVFAGAAEIKSIRSIPSIIDPDTIEHRVML